MSDRTYTSANSGDGKGTIGFDGKVGHIVNAGVTAVTLAVVEAIGSIDLSTLPTAAATLAAPALGLVVGWLTTKFLPRFRRA